MSPLLPLVAFLLTVAAGLVVFFMCGLMAAGFPRHRSTGEGK